MTSPKPAPALLGAVQAWLKTSETPNSEATRAKAVLPLAEHFGHDTALADLDAGDIAEWFSQKVGRVSAGDVEQPAVLGADSRPLLVEARLDREGATWPGSWTPARPATCGRRAT